MSTRDARDRHIDNLESTIDRLHREAKALRRQLDRQTLCRAMLTVAEERGALTAVAYLRFVLGEGELGPFHWRQIAEEARARLPRLSRPLRVAP